MPYKDISKRKKYQKKYQAQWRKDNKKKWSKIARKSDVKRNKKLFRKIQIRSAHSREHIRNKLKVFQIYGKVCLFCKEDRYELLTVDHINNNGANHRNKIKLKGFRNIYDYLAKTEFRPDLYQILCYNCNAAKQHYNIAPGKNMYRPFKFWNKISELRKKR